MLAVHVYTLRVVWVGGVLGARFRGVPVAETWVHVLLFSFATRVSFPRANHQHHHRLPPSPFPRVCVVCIQAALWDNSPSVASQFGDSSSGRFVLDKATSTIVKVQINA